MAAKKATKKKASKKAAKKGTKRRRGVTVEPTALTASDLPFAEIPDELSSLVADVKEAGGAIIGAYREPIGGKALLIIALPIEHVAPTPFQRDVSDSHVRKLTRAIDKTRRFLDPIIVVFKDGKFWTPNGSHRLTVLKELGAQSVVGLLVPEAEVAYQILALNIEKAHNLRERALEVVRMFKDLSDFSKEKESSYELEFEEPALVTLGFAYEMRPRLSGGAYNPALKKVDAFLDVPLKEAMEVRKKRAEQLIELDDAVAEAVKKLKESGLNSPYLKTFVVARVNPLRFIKGDLPSFEELLATMTKRARGMNAGKIKAEDLARAGGAPDE